ncbi:MAG: hypothetical protein ACRYFS_18315 [Janthinobacterium lividum]
MCNRPKFRVFQFFFSLAFALAGCSLASAQAALPGVSFSPAAIDFGQLPSDDNPTQLLTVTFDKSMFPSNHLPVLRGPWWIGSGPEIAIFSRFEGPKTIQIVYRIKISSFGESGPIHYNLTLVRDKTVSKEDDATVAAEDNGVLVKAEFVPGLVGSPPKIDFGPVRYGKGAIKEFTAGFYHSNIVSEDELSRKPKAGTWSLIRSLDSMTVTSTSPYFMAVDKREMGLNASAWETWQIVLSSKAPQKKLDAELTFQTGDGYSLTVPVTADLSDPGYPIPPWEPSKPGKH